MTKKQKVLVIIGPTAVGKTALSIELAQEYQGEIISGDSLQVYQGLDIGTAKVTEEEKAGVPHHLIDIRTLAESFSVADFQVLAREKITEIAEAGKLPIVVGGTGLYIQALLFDFELGSQDKLLDTSQLRKELTELAELEGNVGVWERLRRQDPAAAESIHPNNLKRVIRGIELIELTGKSITEQKQTDFRDLSNSLYDVKLIALETERDLLYQRINQRVDQMMKADLLSEAKLFLDQRDSQGTQGIGYKEFFPYFDGEIELQVAVDQVKQNSRRYAKRQLTWFKNRMTAEWWDLVTKPEEQSKLVNEVGNWLDSGREQD